MNAAMNGPCGPSGPCGPCGPCGPWVKQLGGRLYVRDFGAEVIATVELTSSGGWHVYVSEPGCSWSWSDTFPDLATARTAADTAAAGWQLHATETARAARTAWSCPAVTDPDRLA